MKRFAFSILCCAVLLHSGRAFGVTIKDTTFKNTGWVITTGNAKYLFEAGKGVSGFGGLWSNDGVDWLRCYAGPGTFANRGFPNSIGNFGHANRSSGATNTIRDDKRSGDHLIIDAVNAQLHFAYHFFEDHVALEVLKATAGYHFLIETNAGGNVKARYWTGAGTPGQMTSHLDFTPEWIYISDAEDKSPWRLLMVKTPEDNVANECWLQGNNMSGFSWGRMGPSGSYKDGLLSGLENKISLAMVPKEMPHEKVKEMAEKLSKNHLQPINPTPTSVSKNHGLPGFSRPEILSLGSGRYKFNIPSSTKFFEIVDPRGAVVDSYRNTSEKSFIWNGSAFLSGVYLLRAVTEAGTFTTPFVVD